MSRSFLLLCTTFGTALLAPWSDAHAQQAGPFRSERFDEDWRSPGDGAPFGAALKNIDLGHDVSLSVGGDARWRFSWRNAQTVSLLLARRPTLVDTAAALPGDARAAVDHARARGWDGSRSLWLLPGCGLERPDLVLSTPTRLRAWAGRAPLLALHVDDAGLAGALATELAAAPEPSAAQGVERHWHGERCFVLRGRFGGVTVYARRTTDIAAALAAVRRFAPKVGCSLRALGWKQDQASPAQGVPSPSAWETVRGATRHPGPRPMDTIWVIASDDDVRLEEFDHHPEAPGRLWRWFSVHAGRVVERRFPNAGGAPG